MKAKNHFGVLLVLAIFIVVCGGMGYDDAATYLGGEKVTAHVDDCRTEKRRGRRGRTTTVTICTGTWTTADGQKHEGEIGGADQSDAGSDIPARADGDQAVVDEPFENLWPVGAACLLTVVLVIYILFLVMRRGGGSGPPAAPPMPPPMRQPHPGPWPAHPTPAPHPSVHRPPAAPHPPYGRPYPPAAPYPPHGHYPPQGHPGYPPPQWR